MTMSIELIATPGTRASLEAKSNRKNREKAKDAKTRTRKEWGLGYRFDEISGRVIEAAISVHTELGPGFLESIYEKAMLAALRRRDLAYEAQKEVPVFFEEEKVGVHRLDLVVDGKIVAELKAVQALEDVRFAQVKSYLRATGLSVGLLLNFNAPRLVIKRVVLDFRPPPNPTH
jgi:GxxExxY protein